MVRSSGSSSRIGLTSRGARRRGSSAAQLHPVVVRGRAERAAEHLHVPGPGQGAADRAAQPLPGGQAAPRGGPRHPHRDVLVALQPDDLLGQVARVGEVGPPGRRRHGQPRRVPVARSRGRVRVRVGVGLDLAAHLAQPARSRCPGRTPCRPPGPGSRRPSSPRPAPPRPARACSRARRSRRPARPAATTALAEARSGSSRSTPRSNRAEASENSRCRRLIRAVPAAEKCAASMHQVARVLGDLGGQPAHGPGHRDRARGVGDQDVVGVELADHVVEGLQPLARARPGGPRSGPVSRSRSNACSGWPSSSIR